MQHVTLLQLAQQKILEQYFIIRRYPGNNSGSCDQLSLPGLGTVLKKIPFSATSDHWNVRTSRGNTEILATLEAISSSWEPTARRANNNNAIIESWRVKRRQAGYQQVGLYPGIASCRFRMNAAYP